MHASFTGSARPRRQVNLSGRTPNPFAAAAGRQTSATAHNTVAHAQQERLLRQQERERPPAAVAIQRTWRGSKDRRNTRNRWREEWDARETEQDYSEQHSLAHLRLLVQFASPKRSDDIERLRRFAARYLSSPQGLSSAGAADAWTYPLLRLAKMTMGTLSEKGKWTLPEQSEEILLRLLALLAAHIPLQLALYSHEYYEALARLTSHLSLIPKEVQLQVRSTLQDAVVALFQPINARTILAYEGFARAFLVVPDLPKLFGNLDFIANSMNYKLLASAIDELLQPSSRKTLLDTNNQDELLWLLSYLIHFRRRAIGRQSAQSKTVDAPFVNATSKLVSSLSEEIVARMDVADNVQGDQGPDSASSQHKTVVALPQFVREEILTLVDQDSVVNLLGQLEVDTAADTASAGVSNQASTLASFALTLLRVFPRRSNEVRMSLYLGGISRHSGRRMPAVRYLYQSISATDLYGLVKKDPREAVRLLTKELSSLDSKGTSQRLTQTARDQQWRVVFLFLELYSTALKVMDDEEFLSGTSTLDGSQSWTRQSALPLEQVRDLTLFLKNLAFSMYWYAAELTGVEAPETGHSLVDYFGKNEKVAEVPPERKASKKSASFAGVAGMSLNYVRTNVTGLLRMIYERDSRRKFLPPGHWLMTQWFEMDRFITSVVDEEQHKHQIQESYEDDADDMNDDDGNGEEGGEEEFDDRRYNLVGTSRTQQVRDFERRKRQQQRVARKKYLESVTPRLEILQNTPFFIPFATRVQIFRQFVALDQFRRRGTDDPDSWRFLMMNHSQATGQDTISKYRARVRRESIFDDAFESFYGLGENLKEPIQIEFVDKFGTKEEGIDGGGVTKEFLTSVTNEAFTPNEESEQMFVENDHHLLYPNPSILDERRYFLQEAGLKELSPEWRDSIRDVLRRYEFLGRIVGKCLYEGILVDIHFAGFFLLKWALTGGSGAASKESNYRANLNDLRDLDEGLYQGLLQLKNYTGNVEDFSLNFAVTDTIQRRSHNRSQQREKTVTRELCAGGSSMTVNNSNRLIYISSIVRHRLSIQPHHQTSAFLRGLGAIISPSWLSMFNQSELQTLLGGDSSEIDVANLRRNTQYGGVYSIGDDNLEHPSIQLFWEAMASFSDEDRRKVLKFVTSTPRAPLLGFEMLQPRFSIRDSGGDQTRLPSTSTCVNLLKLPIYKDINTLKEKLLYSINSGAGFNLS